MPYYIRAHKHTPPITAIHTYVLTITHTLDNVLTSMCANIEKSDILFTLGSCIRKFGCIIMFILYHRNISIQVHRHILCILCIYLHV